LNSSLEAIQLAEYVTDQVNYFLPDKNSFSAHLLCDFVELAMASIDYCFSHIAVKHYNDQSGTLFNHLHSDQYAMFLQILSNLAYEMGTGEVICTKLYLLNKILHGIDCYYEIKLPSIFLFSHPLGTVLGRAEYSDYFLVSQNCTVGGVYSSNGYVYPQIGPHCAMYAGSAIIGNSKTGSNCKLTQNSILFNTLLPPNSVFMGNISDSRIKRSSRKINDFLDNK